MFRWIKGSRQAEHEFCQENLSSFLDRELTEREQARVMRHLEQCADCRADLQSLRQTVALLRATPVVKPPRSFLLPASEGVRQRQVQRSRLAYGYLQFATAVATVLLVLVVSGDALLRLGVAQPARLATPSDVQTVAVYEGAPAEETTPPAAAELRAPMPAPTMLAAVPPPSGEATAVTMLAQSAAPDEASQTEAAQVVEGGPEVAEKAMPSQTLARAAGAPPLPTATQEGEVGAPAAAQTAQPELTATVEAGPTEALLAAAPTETPVPPTETPLPPTATPLPTATPVPPTATPLPTATPEPAAATPVPAPLEETRQELPPPAAAGGLGWLQRMQLLLRWLEWTLGALVAVLLIATLWVRRRARAA